MLHPGIELVSISYDDNHYMMRTLITLVRGEIEKSGMEGKGKPSALME